VLREDADLLLKLCCLPSSSFFKYLEYSSMLSLFLLFLFYFTAKFSFKKILLAYTALWKQNFYSAVEYEGLKKIFTIDFVHGCSVRYIVTEGKISRSCKMHFQI